MSDSELRDALRTYDRNDLASVVRTVSILERQAQRRKLALPSMEVLKKLPTWRVEGTSVEAHGITPQTKCYSFGPLRDWHLDGVISKRAMRVQSWAESGVVQDVFQRCCPRLPLGRILPPKEKPLRALDQDGVRMISDSIKRVGMVQPIHIDEGRHLIDGQHRLAAAKLLKWKEVPVWMVVFHEDGQRMQAQVVRDMLHGRIQPIQLQDNRVVDGLHRLRQAQEEDE